MKKFLVVLLIAVLVSGFAFADAAISGGKVVTTAHFDWSDADKVDYGIHTKATIFGGASFTLFNFGEGNSLATNNASYPFASVKASLALKAKDGIKADYSNNNAIPVNYSTGYAGERVLDFGVTGLTLTFSLDEAKIIGEKWVLDLLKGPSIADFAKSPVYTEHIEDVDDDYDENKHTGYSYNAVRKLTADEGITFALTDYFTAGLILKNEDSQHVVVAIESSEAAGQLSDKVSAQAGVAYEYVNGESYIHPSAKIGIDGEASLHIAGDFAIDATIDATEEPTCQYEVAADFAYDVLTADFYWSHDATRTLIGKKTTDNITADVGYVMIARATLDFTEKLPEFAPYFHVFVADDSNGHLGEWHIDATVAGAFNPFITNWTVAGEGLYHDSRALAVSATANLLAIAPDFPASAFELTVGTEDALNFADEGNGLYAKFVAEDVFVAGLSNELQFNEIGRETCGITYDYAYENDTVVIAGGVEGCVHAPVVCNVYQGFEYTVAEGLAVGAYAKYDVNDKELIAAGSVQYSGKFDFAVVAKGSHIFGDEPANDFAVYAKASSKNIITGAELAIQYGDVEDKPLFGSILDPIDLAKRVEATCTINF